ncbi:hypothetical protein BJ170DRAFT_677174 [Xylariales sp. AK1849]|nr:hypothetical protein BJ170DRAFT_677174 [Xylariales sp. AK1849]
MWRSKKSRRPSESTSSASAQLLEDDGIYLPGSSVYLTTTKSGRPALARKKRDKVLEDFGFDILGQSFGVPSRMDFERGRRPIPSRARSRSARSTPVPRIIELETDDDEDSISSTKTKKINKTSSESASTPRKVHCPKYIEREPLDRIPIHPTLKSKRGGRPRTGSSFVPLDPLARTRFAEYDAEDGSVWSGDGAFFPGSFCVPPPPVPFQIPPAIATYQAQTAPASYYPPMAYPSAAASYVHQGPPAAQVPSNPLLQQGYGVSPFSHAWNFAVPQSSAIPQERHPFAPTMERARSTYFSFPPPPPPPPGAVPVREGAIATGVGDGNGLTSPNEEDDIKNHFETFIKPRFVSREKANKDQSKLMGEVPENDSKNSVRHKHVCAGCGKSRSKGYHMVYRLKRGEIPEPGYCRRCVAAADFTDSEASESIAARISARTPPPVAVASTHEDFLVSSGQYTHDKRSQRHKQGKKPWRSSFLKAMSASTSHGNGKRISSLSAAEESSSRASSRVSTPRVRHQRLKSSAYRSVRLSQPKSPLCEPPTKRSSIKRINTGSKTSTEASSRSKSPREAEARVPNFSFKTSPKLLTVAPSGGTNRHHKDYESWYKKPDVHTDASEVQSRVSDSGPSRVRRGNGNSGSSREGAGVDQDRPRSRNGQRKSGNTSSSGKKAGSNEQAVFDENHSGVDRSSGKSASSGKASALMQHQAFDNIRKLDDPLEDPMHDERDTLPEPEMCLLSPSFQGGYDDMPSTPADANAGFDHATHPHIRRESWEHGQGQLERLAEQMVEEELTRAGKRSGLFGGSCRGSASPTFPSMSTNSHLTPSLISIESCNSDEERVDGNAHYEMSAGSASDNEDRTTVQEEEEESPKQLEFSSYEDQSRKKSPTSHPSGSILGRRSHKHRSAKETRSGQSSDTKVCNNDNNDGNSSNNSNRSFDFLAPSEGSSILVHTGHSADNITRSSDNLHDTGFSRISSSAPAPRRRIRRFGIC